MLTSVCPLALGPDVTNKFALMIDCNCLTTSRCGSGPVESGPFSPRWDPDLQKSFYNGWKCVDGLKHQTVDSAHGMTVDISGPVSLRRNDLHVYSNSRINQRISNLCDELEVDYMIFGDSAYSGDTHCMSYMQGPDPNGMCKRFNGAMKAVRIMIEWNYMVTANHFRAIGNIRKLLLKRSTTVTKMYTVATLLRNCHVCFNGSITSKYFDIVIASDMFEKYMNQTE